MAADLRAQLRKLEFPGVVVEALNQLQKILTSPMTPLSVQICNEVFEEFVFMERRRKKLSAVRELHLLDVLCTSFQTMSHENGRNLFFVMFPTTDRIVLERRLAVLTKLVSLAVTLNVDVLLDCAAFWMHVAGISGDVSVQLTRQLLRELFDTSVPDPTCQDDLGADGQSVSSCLLPPTALQLIQTSPAFCASFLTSVTFLHSTAPPPRRLLYLLSAWLEANLFLAFVPLESVTPTAQTFVPGLVTWTTMAGVACESAEDKSAKISNGSDGDRLDLTNGSDAALINKLHLALLKIILKAPPGTLQADHLMKLAHTLQSRIAATSSVGERPSTSTVWRIERFLQVIQAALSSCCIQGSLRGLKTALVRLPNTQLTGIVLETNKAALLA